jgi:hypothetical protein
MAERALAGPEPRRHRRIQHRYAIVGVRPMFDAERHSVEHRNTHRFEVSGRDDAAIDENGLAVRLRLPGELHAHEHVAASEWKAVDERGPLHPRQCRQPGQRLVGERAARSRIAIPRGGQRDAAGEHLVR